MTSRRRFRRSAVAGCLLGALGSLVLTLSPATAAKGDVPPGEDNPPGCVTAKGESDPACGAEGRDHFGNAGHTPPIQACANKTAPTGSKITRILPNGPRHADGTPAFTSGVCVYLPPGYAKSGLRYPVLYLLHGGGGDQADWVTFGTVQPILDAAYATDPSNALIVIMPDGRSGQHFDYQDGSFLIETYILRHVIPAIDSRYRTIADRAGRAIAGLSNGGYGALHLAAKAPDLFVAAGSMSGNLGARTMSGLGPTGEAYYEGNIPYSLASNLDAVDMIIDWGATCTADATVDLCATWGFEQAFRGDNMAFRNQLDMVGYTGTVDYRETEGGHAWRWWTQWLVERDLPFFYERLSPPVPAQTKLRSPLPETFRYRSIFPTFTVWGYDVSVERDVSEFLDLTEVTSGGFTVQGSGRVAVTTAPRYRPGVAYDVAIDGAAPKRMKANPAGRLKIAVDLGPSHTADQFTPEARLAEAAGDSWVTRIVTITRAR